MYTLLYQKMPLLWVITEDNIDNGFGFAEKTCLHQCGILLCVLYVL